MNDELFLKKIYIEKLSTRLELFTQIRDNLWNARCPVCGDSKKNKYKKRFYIYFKNDDYKVKCHNCGYSSSFLWFLKEHESEFYSSYMIEVFKTPSIKNNVSGIEKKSKQINDLKNIKAFNYDSLKLFNELSFDHPARKYVERRKIPFNRIFYCDDFSRFVAENCHEYYIETYKNHKYSKIIIPFYTKKGSSFVFQARSLEKKDKCRYITIKSYDDAEKIYGLDKIDSSIPVFILEGPIDSMMIPNAIANSGLTSIIPKYIKKRIFVFDNEPRNKDVVNYMDKMLRNGDSVVIFPDNLQYKDLNDMVVGGYSTKKILDLLIKNTYNGFRGLVRLNSWKK